MYLTLAIIENPNPPAYEALAPEDGGDAESATTLTADGPAPDRSKPITSSLRATNRLLRSIGGWRSNFRGFWCDFALGFATVICRGIFGAFTYPWIGTLLASLALVQLSTAWVTIAISQPSPRPFWRRLPPLRRTFEATCFPVLTQWLALTITAFIPLGIARLIRLDVWDPSNPSNPPTINGHSAWKGLIVFIVSMTLYVLLVIPSQVVLRRVQASLLPPDEDAIVSFDRSYDGTLEPALVGGKGFVTMKDAFRTFSRDSWIRLYKLYFKIFLATLALYTFVSVVFLIEFFSVAAATPQDGPN